MSSDLQKALQDTCSFLQGKIKIKPKIAVTLGSGLSAFAKELKSSVSIPYSEIPHFKAPTVEGHGGNFVAGLLGSIPVAVLQGRIHYYEGHDPAQVVFPTRVLATLGVKTLLISNAAGGLDPSQRPGDFMIIRDHINLTGMNPLRGPNPEFLGPRFPDMSDAYTLALRPKLRRALESAKARFSEGVYCGVAGPCYETAAEVRFLQIIGGQAVGMSTVAETIAARHAGMQVAGLACITNLATGLSSGPISHQEVKDIAQQVEKQFAHVVSTFLSDVGS